MRTARSFPPVAGRGARALVLGSVPGQASLAAGRYYAHPRNSFWRIVEDSLGGGRRLPYAARLRLLRGAGLALWDVLASCVRAGSSDSAIRRDSIRVNPLEGFFRRHPAIRVVLFNGGKAEECFRRHVLPGLPRGLRLKYRRLPSTSPAHASLSYAAKLAAWRRAFRGVERQ